MRRVVLSLLMCGLLWMPACAKAQEKKAGSTDPASIERFIRRYYNWPKEVKIEVGPLKPSGVPGLLETTVKLSAADQHQDEQFLISSDGRYILRGPMVSMGADPFASVREKMDLKDFPTLGSPTAPITIVEYSDFQCPYCQGVATALKDVMVPEFKGQVRLVFKDFPLNFHPWAMPAAQLGRCIYKTYGNDFFWTYHDWAFSNQAQLNPQNFKEKAAEYEKSKGLDGAKLNACMAQPEIAATVEKSIAEAMAVGVTGTPTMFLNGRKVVGSLPLPQIRENIQTELNYATGKMQ